MCGSRIGKFHVPKTGQLVIATIQGDLTAICADVVDGRRTIQKKYQILGWVEEMVDIISFFKGDKVERKICCAKDIIEAILVEELLQFLFVIDVFHDSIVTYVTM